MSSKKKSESSEFVLIKKLQKLLIVLEENGYDQEFVYKLLKPYNENNIEIKKDSKITTTQFTREMLSRFHNFFNITPNVALSNYFKTNIREEFGDEYSFTYLSYILENKLDKYYYGLGSDEHKCNFLITKLRDCKHEYKRRVSDMENTIKVFMLQEEKREKYNNRGD